MKAPPDAWQAVPATDCVTPPGDPEAPGTYDMNWMLAGVDAAVVTVTAPVLDSVTLPAS